MEATLANLSKWGPLEGSINGDLIRKLILVLVSITQALTNGEIRTLA